jgi:hypothetical protein
MLTFLHHRLWWYIFPLYCTCARHDLNHSFHLYISYICYLGKYFADQHAYRLKIAFVPSSTPFSGISSTRPNSLWDPTPRPCTCHSCVQSCFRDLKTPYSAGPATTQSYRPDGPDASDRTMLPPILELAAAAVGPTFSLWQFMIMDV